ncbi:MAG TPA: hypothetical protein VEF71_01410, partial [Streptosporangiaceae bacterium]|nr:hypothetical protein [Streptosporangiaceae bacterium]
AHRSRHDSSSLRQFASLLGSDDLMQRSPDERAQVLARSLARIRPELDPYLMTEISVEDLAGRLSHHFRRIFHSREGSLELHLSILDGIAARYRAPFFSALRSYSHRPTGVFHALPVSHGKSIVNSHWIRDMVDFYGLEIFLAETSATCGGLDSLLEPTGPLREAQQQALAELLRSPGYRADYDVFAEEVGSIDAAADDVLLDRRLMPDPARARIRVYSTQSTHKTLTSLRQGSMIHVWDQDFSQKVDDTFHEAYMTHTSTSPNYQILASLDLGRRQAALEGFELVQKQIENAMRLRDAVDHHPLLSRYMHCLTTADLIPAEYRPSGIDQPLRSGLPNMIKAWEADEFVMDPSRVTIYIGATGIEGDSFKRSQLMDRYGVQINKTSRNTVLFMTTIGTTRSSVAYLIEVLVTIARDLDAQLADMNATERAAHERAVLRLTAPSAPLPDFSGFHPSFTDGHGLQSPEGDVRRAFYLAYNDSYCEYLTPDEVEQRVQNGEQVVSTTYVTPYPPGFPVLVPGQLFSTQILSFMRSLDTPEIHGYRADCGYRVYLDKALEIAATTRPVPLRQPHEPAPPPRPPGAP